SVRGMVDDIVVVDTGSTDATKAIAVHHGARVLDFAWCDDFSAARQHAFDHATGDWVMWLDADDVGIGASHLGQLITGAPDGTKGFYCQYVLARDARGVATFLSWRERVVRHDGAYRWAGRVHEVLVATKANALLKTERVVIEHRPEPMRGDGSRRNLRILEEE